MQSIRVDTSVADWPQMQTKKTAVSIRRATHADAATIAEMGSRLLPVAHPGALPPADMNLYLNQSFNVNQITQELRDPAARFLLAEFGRRAAGMVKISPATPPVAGLGRRPVELSRLYLNPGWIGKGVGSALMRHALTAAAGAGYDVCWLSVWTKNDRAQAFYRRWGFARCDTVHYPIGRSEIAMLVMAYPFTLKR